MRSKPCTWSDKSDNHFIPIRGKIDTYMQLSNDGDWILKYLKLALHASAFPILQGIIILDWWPEV